MRIDPLPDCENPPAVEPVLDSGAREAWESIIGELVQWGKDPSQFEDEDGKAPSMRTIQLAIELAESLRDLGAIAPARVVPDANAGIVFERREQNVFESYRISADATAEHCVFRNAQLIRRESVLPPFDRE